MFGLTGHLPDVLWDSVQDEGVALIREWIGAMKQGCDVR
jgi:hypothetical protein